MSESKSSGGISFLGLLGIAFIVLKLCHVIDWSWWWVTCPLWAGFAIVLVMLAAYVFLKAGRQATKERARKNNSTPTKSKWQMRLEEMQAAKQRQKGMEVDKEGTLK